MADTKISQLTSATTPLAGTEVLPIVQSSSTKKVSVDNLTTGKNVKGLTFNATGTNAASSYKMADWEIIRYVNTTADIGGWTASQWTALRLWANGSISATLDSSGNIKFDYGNLIQGTAAKGINFTANTAAAGMTSQLLNYYEEGTWTPAWGGSTSNPTVTYDTRAGKYTRIGNTVFFDLVMIVSAASGGSGDLILTGLPFTINATTSGNAYINFAYNFAANGPATLLASNGSTQFNCYSAEHGTTNAKSPVSSLTSGSFNVFFRAGGFYFV